MPNAFTRYAILIMILIGFGFSVYACGRATDSTQGSTKLEKLSIGEMERMDFAFRGDQAPDVSFLGPFGKKVALADFQGQVVLVNIWATWCGPCEKEMPSLAALQTARGSNAFKVIAISVDELEDREFVKGELQKLTGGALDFYQSEDLTLLGPLGVNVFPTTIIYDRSGNEVSRLYGDADWASADAVNFIDAVISGG